ncbi:hypothetical protein OGAPHI_002594 [Ogataea philodendri]|uniref:Oxidoreductase n=1 Tax=Ogataea philodendri TaxID=1378263 RepID=A0A9P8T7U9_9ASCO|nr:uncharacterized protein OGAPHI_002594 [Ogataea philodendri]KAH3668839.1 hypothetical protein OGAPHI_002594 [Ogataea philodendri]
MPLNILGTILLEGTDKVPGWDYVKMYGPLVVLAGSLKYYLNGSTNTWERDLHGKVYMVTGGTSGIGASLVYDLAKRGAQLVLLTSQLDLEGVGTAWIADYIQDLRDDTGNQLIYAESCDLSSLYSVRKFATKWLDQTPPRRLDGILCLAADSEPSGKARESSVDGVEIQMAVNYLGHYHLLTLLEPALKVQPADRDVRVLLASCMSQSLGEINLDDLLWEERKYPSKQPWKVYGSSKLMLSMFAKEYQRRLDMFQRKDGEPNNTRLNVVNPGIVRTPSTRRVLSLGTVWGLFLYVLMYPIWWFLLKSGEHGMQSFLFAMNTPELVKRKGGNYIKECSIVSNETRSELKDEQLQATLFDKTKELIEVLEKRSAIERNRTKIKPKEEKKKKDKQVKKDDGVLSEADRLSVFKSAFKDQPLPNRSLQLTPEEEKQRNLRLTNLDKKLNKSRKA